MLGFNPRTRMGCDWLQGYHLSGSWRFNPRTRMGCDQEAHCQYLRRNRVSIHAPAWGATVSIGHIIEVNIVSIHAPAWGATKKPIVSTSDATVFQSTHPHGVRPLVLGTSSKLISFQSTHPHGVRPSTRCILPADLRFQSTHPHGVRLDNVSKLFLTAVSIHAPAWCATTCPSPHCRTRRISIHAPAWGATQNQ